MVIAHGAPERIDEYVFPEKVPRRVRRDLRTLEADVLLLGHTHRPMVLRLGALWIINPGSVAGARARDSHTCAIIELPSRSTRFFDLATGAERDVPPIAVGPIDGGNSGIALERG